MFLFIFHETSYRRETSHFTEKCFIVMHFIAFMYFIEKSIIDYEWYNKRHNVPLQ